MLAMRNEIHTVDPALYVLAATPDVMNIPAPTVAPRPYAIIECRVP